MYILQGFLDMVKRHFLLVAFEPILLLAPVFSSIIQSGHPI